MSFSVQSIQYKSYPVRMHEFKTSPTQDIGKYLYRCATRLKRLSKNDAPIRSGALKKSITILRYNRGPVGPSIEVGATVPHAYYVHEGTQPHTIKALPGRVMGFKHNGRIIYARKVNHPGTKPNRYLSTHLYAAIQE